MAAHHCTALVSSTEQLLLRSNDVQFMFMTVLRFNRIILVVVDRIAFCCDAQFLSSRFKVDYTGVLATLMKYRSPRQNQQCFEFFKLNQQVAPPQVPVASIKICLWIYSCGGPFNGCMGSRSTWYSTFGLCIDIMYVSFNGYNVTVMNIWLSLLNNMKGHIFCRPCITPV